MGDLNIELILLLMKEGWEFNKNHHFGGVEAVRYFGLWIQCDKDKSNANMLST